MIKQLLLVCFLLVLSACVSERDRLENDLRAAQAQMVLQGYAQYAPEPLPVQPQQGFHCTTYSTGSALAFPGISETECW